METAIIESSTTQVGEYMSTNYVAAAQVTLLWLALLESLLLCRVVRYIKLYSVLRTLLCFASEMHVERAPSRGGVIQI